MTEPAFPRPRVVVVRWLPGLDLAGTAGDVEGLLRRMATCWTVLPPVPAVPLSEDELRDAWSDADGFVLSNPAFSAGITPARVFNRRLARLFPDAAMEEDVPLASQPFRDRFLSLLFSLARFRPVAASGSIGQLTGFHAAHKYLLQAYSEQGMRELGAMVATAADRPWDEVVHAYRSTFIRSLARPARLSSHANALTHAFGHVTDRLDPSDRRQFLGLVERLLAGEQVVHDALRMLRQWAEFHDVTYLRAQLYLDPYPSVPRTVAR